MTPTLEAYRLLHALRTQAGLEGTALLVEAETADERAYAPTWLLRIAASHAHEYNRWRARGPTLTVAGRTLTARPAPLIRPLGTLPDENEHLLAAAAEAQLRLPLTQPPTHITLYATTHRLGAPP